MDLDIAIPLKLAVTSIASWELRNVKKRARDAAALIRYLRIEWRHAWSPIKPEELVDRASGSSS